MTIVFEGLDPVELQRIMRDGVDHAGSPVAPFVDGDGDWPLRCCLTDSRPGDRLAIIAFSNFPWISPYRTTGPVVVHAEPCAGVTGAYPLQFDDRTQVVRAYGRGDDREHSLIYDLNAIVPAGGGLADSIDRVLRDDRVEFVHVHNVISGCYSFTARRDIPE